MFVIPYTIVFFSKLIIKLKKSVAVERRILRNRSIFLSYWHIKVRLSHSCWWDLIQMLALQWLRKIDLFLLLKTVKKKKKFKTLFCEWDNFDFWNFYHQFQFSRIYFSKLMLFNINKSSLICWEMKCAQYY